MPSSGMPQSGHYADIARESESMLGCCWAIVRDGGPTLKQHWLTVQWVLQRYGQIKLC